MLFDIPLDLSILKLTTLVEVILRPDLVDHFELANIHSGVTKNVEAIECLTKFIKVDFLGAIGVCIDEQHVNELTVFATLEAFSDFFKCKEAISINVEILE